MTLKERGHESVYEIHMTQNREQWWAPVNTAVSLGSIKGRDFPDKLSVYWLLKKDYAPWRQLVS
jgi:hypothetical protein